MIINVVDGVSKGMPILDEVDGFPKGDTGNRLVLAVITIFSILVHIKTRIVVWERNIKTTYLFFLLFVAELVHWI